MTNDDRPMTEDDKVALDKLQKYLQIKTVQPHPDYSSCVNFLLDVPSRHSHLIPPGCGSMLRS